MIRSDQSSCTPTDSCPREILSQLIVLTPPLTLFPYTTLFRSPPGRGRGLSPRSRSTDPPPAAVGRCVERPRSPPRRPARSPGERSEEHTSELQSRFDLVCRLLLEKKKKKNQFEEIAGQRLALS